MAASAGTIAAISSEQATLEYSTDGGTTWNDIPGVAGYEESGGEKPTRDVIPFAGGVAKRVGRPRVPGIESSLIATPSHAAYTTLRTAFYDKTILSFRLTTQELSLFSGGGTVAITTAGLVTFTAGASGELPGVDNNTLGPGAVIKLSTGDNYVIEFIDPTTNAVTVAPAPTSAESGETYSLVVPAQRRGPFQAEVVNIETYSLAVEAELTVNFMIQPLSSLPAWEIV